ncbi:MAG: DNA mismatch repair protein MutS [Pirellulaceae bacterium]|nr:DNA mismatch repair protein MutS [Pirellulaceae bacterium]
MTPMMRQYENAKSACGDAILLFRMGDFYELFHDDAKIAAKILGLTLTSRDKGENPVPMAGFPHHQLDAYLGKLIRAGHRVAVCDQVENPQTAKGLVRREITQIVSPGTITEGSLLDPSESNYLAALVRGAKDAQSQIGISWVDLSTGLFAATIVPEDLLRDLLERLHPSEVLLGQNQKEILGQFLGQTAVTTRPDWSFGEKRAVESLCKQFSVATLDGFGFLESDTLALQAAAGVIDYLRDSQSSSLEHIVRLAPYRPGDVVEIDQATWRSLEVTRTIRNGDRKGSLFDVLDRAVTPMGSRLLGQWLSAPLREPAKINERLEGVSEFVNNPSRRNEIRQQLRSVFDLERVVARVVAGRAGPRDLKQIAKSLSQLPTIRGQLQGFQSSLLANLYRDFELLPELREQLETSLVDDCPLQTSAGGFIRDHYNAELDHLRQLAQGGKQWIANYQQKITAETQIPNLKIGFNKVFGYYLEVTQSHQSKVPNYFIRKQTLKNVERYITPELKDYEEKVLSADEQSIGLELQLFEELKSITRAQAATLKRIADRLALIDQLCGLAQLAADQNYCRPDVDDGDEIEIIEGRHPVLDILQPLGAFVPNDTHLNETAGLIHLITGPNMAGKSTYIRQVALLTLMAQIGSFVPAKSARIGVVDRIFARVGANDELSRGQSTFMVEMTETARILNTASRRSLVILDEIGRGTSTYDGVSLAWAIVEFLHEHLQCRTLFATHYHEMTALSETFQLVKNYNVSVREWNDKIVFLHKIIPGAADRSYGIHVARLAGVPDWVNRRAEQILEKLESGRNDDQQMARSATRRSGEFQMTLFEITDHPLIEKIRRIDPNHVTPIRALEMLQAWQQELLETSNGNDNHPKIR